MAEAAVRQREPQTTRQSRRDTPFFVAGGRERNAQNSEAKIPDGQSKLILLKQKIENSSVEQKAHKRTNEIVAGTRNSVSVDTTLQQSSQENSVRVEEMSEAEPRPFDAAQFEASVIENVEKIIPKTKEEFERDPTSSERMQAANRNMSSTLQTEQGNVTGEIEQAGSTPVGVENISIHQPEEMVTDEVGAAPQIEGAGIAPPLHTEEDTDLSAESREIDESLESSGITEEMLQNGNEPSFAAALGLKQESQSRAENTRSDYLAEANPILQISIDSTEQRTASGVAQMYGMRRAELGTLQTGQDSSRIQEEKIRADVAGHLNGIYNKTKTAVDSKLGGLKDTVRTRFETALASANSTFEANVRERTETGFFESIGRWIAGIPKDVERIFQEEQHRFINALRPVIREISELMETELNETMAIIHDGKQEMQNYWDSQDTETQRIAGDLFAAAGERYTALEQQVNETNDQLQDDITQQFTDAVNSLRETFDRIKEENKNWLERARDAVVGVIEAIIEMKNMLLGILRDAADTVMIIINDPVGFLANLLNAIRMGFMGFVGNILTYIKEGLIAWLLGNMPPGIIFPERWDLRGVFTFVASIIGLTWENIKDRAIRKFGPRVVAALETAFEVFVIIREQGIAGLWEYIKEKLINLKDQVLGAIQEMLITKVIQAGVTWIISMFNPAGAFLKACKMIYDVIVWFVNNARRLLELVRSIVDSVAMIAAGNLNAAARYVERTLARTVPIVIGFLAGLLGIGDLSAKVQKIIDKIREPINKAIDWILDEAKSIAQRLMAAGRRGVETVAGWLGIKKNYRSKDGNSHELFFEEKNGIVVLMRKSVADSFQNYIRKVKEKIKEQGSEETYKQQLDHIERLYSEISGNLRYDDFNKNDINSKMAELARHLEQLPDDLMSDDLNIVFPTPEIEYLGSITQKVPEVDNESNLLNSNDGVRATAKNLSINMQDISGSGASYDSPLKKFLVKKTGKSLKSGHLLSHFLGGSGNNPGNIAPIRSSANTQMESNKDAKVNERLAKSELLAGSVFDFEVNIQYLNSNKLNIQYPANITMNYQKKQLKKPIRGDKREYAKVKSNWENFGSKLSHNVTNELPGV